MKLVFDLEGNDLYEGISTVHCICTLDIDSGIEKSYDVVTNNINDGLAALMTADTLIGHNIIGYDIRSLTKLYDWFKLKPETRLFDTWVLSQLLNQERRGGHGLEAWGVRAGIPKPEHEDWSQFSKGMLYRCRQDVRINKFTYHELIKEAYDIIEGVEYGKIF